MMTPPERSNEGEEPEDSGGLTAGITGLRGREVAELGEERFAGYVRGATVLVTGAGGSLGRALCHRLASLGAGRLVLVDQAEAALVEIHQELRYEGRFACSVPVLADLRSAARARQVITTHRPHAVFHTAAYKLVPIVEAHPIEAAANNVLATDTLVQAAAAAGAGRFVLYSTDKAIEPESVLGWTKAAAECIVGTAARRSPRTRFACVRLGNVLESSGSMLPLFRRQVASRASVTVTDSRMTRYVMTIAETVALAVVAGGLAARGDVFRLDMGRPVSVVDAARAVVADAGQEARGAIEIVGSRPGEKLHERLEAPGEPVWETDQDRVVRSGPRHADPLWLDGELLRLRMLVDAADADGVRVQLERLVERIQVDGTPVHPVGLG